jgi:hypothetical protein
MEVFAQTQLRALRQIKVRGLRSGVPNCPRPKVTGLRQVSRVDK